MNVHAIFEGSDGEATRALYARLEALGPVGVVAMNLFRAQKCSSRAKVYRGGGFRRDAYERKTWSLTNLAQVLEAHGVELGLRWGWKVDPQQERHCWVLYVDLPQGQVSFHTGTRGKGPDYSGDWDGSHQSPGRVVTFVSKLLNAPTALELARDSVDNELRNGRTCPNDTDDDGDCGRPYCPVCGALRQNDDQADRPEASNE